MLGDPHEDPVLKRFRAAVSDLYGDRLERVVLYGSRARGEERPDSDYDVAVFLRGMDDGWLELTRLADIGTEILYDVGKSVHATAHPAGAEHDRTPLMHEIRKDGLEV